MIRDDVINPINIIACTAFGAHEDIKSIFFLYLYIAFNKECMDAGMCDFVIKPITFSMIYNLV